MKQHTVPLVAILALALGSATIHARSRPVPVVSPDNSLQNAFLRHESDGFIADGLTAENQPNDRDDRVTAARVRRVIVSDPMLSFYAHNVKVIAAHGTVTLVGPVYTDDERLELAADAATVVDPRHIINRITVA